MHRVRFQTLTNPFKTNMKVSSPHGKWSSFSEILFLFGSTHFQFDAFCEIPDTHKSFWNKRENVEPSRHVNFIQWKSVFVWLNSFSTWCILWDSKHSQIFLSKSENVKPSRHVNFIQGKSIFVKLNSFSIWCILWDSRHSQILLKQMWKCQALKVCEFQSVKICFCFA